MSLTYVVINLHLSGEEDLSFEGNLPPPPQVDETMKMLV